jgi:hypothetical protein
MEKRPIGLSAKRVFRASEGISRERPRMSKSGERSACGSYLYVQVWERCALAARSHAIDELLIFGVEVLSNLPPAGGEIGHFAILVEWEALADLGEVGLVSPVVVVGGKALRKIEFFVGGSGHAFQVAPRDGDYPSSNVP